MIFLLPIMYFVNHNFHFDKQMRTASPQAKFVKDEIYETGINSQSSEIPTEGTRAKRISFKECVF